MTKDIPAHIYNSSNLLDFIYKKKWPLVIVCFVAVVVSSIISLKIPEKFKSTVVLFPASSSSISQSLVTESQQKKDILKFGEEEEVEQLMQMLLSTNIRNRIVEKYDLFNHYRIDKNSNHPYSTLYKQYDRNVDISRTEYMSIKIDVYDEDPELAALIANDIAALVDSSYANIQRERAQKAYDIVLFEFEAQTAKIKQIEDSLLSLSKLGVIEVKSQTEMYSEQYAIALANGNYRAVDELGKKLDVLATYGSIHTILKEQMYEEVKKLAVVEAKYREAKIDLEQTLPNKYVVDSAEKAEKKSYPIRWLIVLSSVFSTFLFSLILLLIFDKKKKKWYFPKCLIKWPKYEIMESYYKTKNIFKLIFKWKWHLVVIVCLSCALAVLFSSSWFIKPKFKSTATVYPANIIVLSEESETEQMLELIQSSDIKFKVIDAFNLYEHYGVNKDDDKSKDKILKYYNGNVDFQKTPNEAIVISVVDEVPQTAADMVDSIICYYDQMVLDMQKLKSKEIVKIYQREYHKKLKEIDSLAGALNTYRTEYGLLDLSAQVEKYTEAIYMGKSLDEARTVLGNWEEYGADYQKTDSLYFYAISDMYQAKNVFENATRDVEKVQTFSHVVSKPFPADKKSYPVRWLIVLFSVLGAFLAGVIIIGIIEGNKK